MRSVDWGLSGKVALVTGASSGLGAHFARVLAREGARVAAAARRQERLEALVAEIRAAGGEARQLALDVTDPGSVAAVLEQIEAAWGPVQVLVNNAGIADSRRFLDTDEESFRRLVETNLAGAWRVARAVAQRLVARDLPGSIVNVASILGLRPGYGESLYGTTKAALIHLTRSMALELVRHNIRVNALCPGYFPTEMNETFFATDKGRAFIARTPARRLGRLEELEGPLLLLAGELGSFITGVALPVDGGHLVSSL